MKGKLGSTKERACSTLAKRAKPKRLLSPLNLSRMMVEESTEAPRSRRKRWRSSEATCGGKPRKMTERDGADLALGGGGSRCSRCLDEQ